MIKNKVLNRIKVILVEKNMSIKFLLNKLELDGYYVQMGRQHNATKLRDVGEDLYSYRCDNRRTCTSSEEKNTSRSVMRIALS